MNQSPSPPSWKTAKCCKQNFEKFVYYALVPLASHLDSSPRTSMMSVALSCARRHLPRLGCLPRPLHFKHRARVASRVATLAIAFSPSATSTRSRIVTDPSRATRRVDDAEDRDRAEFRSFARRDAAADAAHLGASERRPRVVVARDASCVTLTSWSSRVRGARALASRAARVRVRSARWRRSSISVDFDDNIARRRSISCPKQTVQVRPLIKSTDASFWPKFARTSRAPRATWYAWRNAQRTGDAASAMAALPRRARRFAAACRARDNRARLGRFRRDAERLRVLCAAQRRILASRTSNRFAKFASFSRDASRVRAIGEECGRANDINERVTSEYVASVVIQRGAAMPCAF